MRIRVKKISIIRLNRNKILINLNFSTYFQFIKMSVLNFFLQLLNLGTDSSWPRLTVIDSSKLSDTSTSSPALKIFDERLLYWELPILIGGLAPGTEYNLTVTGLVRHCPNGDEN